MSRTQRVAAVCCVLLACASGATADLFSKYDDVVILPGTGGYSDHLAKSLEFKTGLVTGAVEAKTNLVTGVVEAKTNLITGLFDLGKGFHEWKMDHFFGGKSKGKGKTVTPGPVPTASVPAGAAASSSSASSSSSSSAASAVPAAAASAVQDCIVGAAAGNPDLSILAAAVGAAGPDVVDLLSSPDSVLTVFAPTDAAFTSLLGEIGLTAEELLGNSTLLLGILSYHLVPDVAALSTDLTDGQELVTALGPTVPLTVELEGGNVVIQGVGSDATVVLPDLEVCNSVVHVIDNVLLPVQA